MFERHTTTTLRETYEALPAETTTRPIFRGCRFVTQQQLNSYVDNVCRTGFTEIQSFSLDPITASRFADPRKLQDSLLQQLHDRAGYKQEHNTLGLLCICDGYFPIDVKFLNREVTHESEVWVNDSRCVVLFRSQEATAIACVLTKPLPVTGFHLEERDLDVVVRLATEAQIEVVVLAPRTMIWPEMDDRQMHTQQPWSNRNPENNMGRPLETGTGRKFLPCCMR